MTASFFQTLKTCKVRYLLISGQAAVLYGAATFSEDIDIWLQPTQKNLIRFINALKACRARFYKITPPLTRKNLLRGHGFHFIIPSAGADDLFLDVMGVPPRSPAFTIALRRSMRMKTHWGILPVISIPDLVEIKKTQRLEDYPVISRLVLRYRDFSNIRLDCRKTRWAMNNLFSFSSLYEFLQRNPETGRHLNVKGLAAMRLLADFIRRHQEPHAQLEQDIERRILHRIAVLQRKDRLYWRKIIAELKQFRSRGLLIPEGRRI